jgi:hypothetical protein
VSVSRQKRKQLKRELDLFALTFLRTEEDWLRNAGLEERVTKEILWSASMFRNSVDADVTPKYVLDTIYKLKTDVCDGSRKLESEEDSAKRWAMVRKWSFRIGGAMFMVVDVAASVASSAVTAPIVAGSIALGAEVAQWGE